MPTQSMQALLLAEGRLGRPDGGLFPVARWTIRSCARSGSGQVCQVKVKRGARGKPWFTTVRGDALEHTKTGVLVTLQRAA